MTPGNDGNGWIQASVEELAGLIVQAEPSNLRLLADMHGRMEKIEEWAATEGLRAAADAIKATARLIEGIILEEVPDGQAALDVAGRAVTSLQAIVLAGRSPDEVTFPAELLGANEPPTAETPAEKPPIKIDAPADDATILADFLARQDSVLEDIEKCILDIESPEKCEPAAAALKRLLHTLKGEAGMLGLANVEKTCHESEDLLGGPLPDHAADTLLAVKDYLAKTFAALAGKGPMPAPMGPLAKPAEPAPAPAPAIPTNSIEGDPALLGEFITESREHLEAADMHLLTLETDPSNEESVHSVFRAFHTIKGVAGLLGLSQIGTLAHEAESLLDKIRKHELAINSQVIDVIFETTDALKRQVNGVQESLESGASAPADPAVPALLDMIRRTAQGANEEKISVPKNNTVPHRRLGEILIEQGSVSTEDVNDALQKQNSDPGRPKLGHVLVEEGKVAPKEVVNALRAQNSVQVKETVKVDADRLDRLVEMIGELVIAESMVSQTSKQGQMGAGFLRHLNELDKITRELQQMGTSLRMVPLRATFQKMARLVRDLSKKSGKQVEFVMAGEDTELDKTVVDRIGDPLVHMVRNAVDHGLESDPADRVRAGKSECGRVELRAFHKGGNIYIEIEDDGRGLDREAILAKGRERGLIAEGETPSDREIYNLIFQPGFSTAKKITDVSGRGVGMDVVKRNIDSLRGQVEIRTEIGKGSVFSIRLPLTLAIIDGMVVRVGCERYIIPTLSVLISIRPEPAMLSTALGKGQMLSHQGRQIPMFRLDEVFRVKGAEQDPTKALAVVVEDDGKQVVLLVDELLGQQQIVIKSLGESVGHVPGVSGGAIMPDGKVGLILDVGGVIRLAQAGK
ncbi:chemotaxis protein CheA [bacterium]|nr:chemotaxis protein CheA [bacterium]